MIKQLIKKFVHYLIRKNVINKNELTRDLLPINAVDLCKVIDEWSKVRYDTKVRYDKGSIEHEKLWAILTALRGPDNEDGILKINTTAILRAFVLPQLAKINHAFVNDDLNDMKFIADGNLNHFKNHFYRAILAVPVLKEKFEENMKEYFELGKNR